MGERQHRLDRGEGDGAVGLQFVEGAGGGEALERLLVHARAVDPPREIGERSERPLARASTIAAASASPTPLIALSA